MLCMIGHTQFHPDVDRMYVDLGVLATHEFDLLQQYYGVELFAKLVPHNLFTSLNQFMPLNQSFSSQLDEIRPVILGHQNHEATVIQAMRKEFRLPLI